MATAERPHLYTSLLPCILTSSFLPHWEDIWSPTRPALCSPPPLPLSSPPMFALHAGIHSDAELQIEVIHTSLQTNNVRFALPQARSQASQSNDLAKYFG